MFKLILLFISIYTPLGKANYDIEYNLYTLHYFESCSIAGKFENKVADCGKIINNPIIALKNNATGFRGLVGLNSVGSPLLGLTYSKTYFIIGAYLQDIKEFQQKELVPVTIMDNESIGLTPIIGIEESIKINDYKIFTIITPVLAVVGIGKTF